jgi:hypothetical protein
VTLTLSQDESQTLERLLRDYLPDLKRELARTESHEFRSLLIAREELCERLLDQLHQSAATAAR